jgi:hypothetical protein
MPGVVQGFGHPGNLLIWSTGISGLLLSCKCLDDKEIWWHR